VLEEEHVAATATDTSSLEDEGVQQTDEGGEEPEDEGGEAPGVYQRGPVKLPPYPLSHNCPVIWPIAKK
jgi:hypothetical protein